MVSISFDIKGSLSEFKKKFIAAIPVILFFLLLFYSIVLLFGTAYALVVSFITATFKVRFQKKCTVRSLFNLFVVQMGPVSYTHLGRLRVPFPFTVSTAPMLQSRLSALRIVMTEVSYSCASLAVDGK